MIHQQIAYKENVERKKDINYQRNYRVFEGVLLQMVDFATKTVEYMTLTQG